MQLPRTPIPVQWLFPQILFRGNAHSREVFLSFDDGPHPEATAFVLDTLAASGAKATFFAVGQNALRYPELLQRIHNEGHLLGNHTMQHLHGLQTPLQQYLQSTDDCHALLKQCPAYRPLFRPPYGRITPAQYRRLRRRYRIVLWDVIAEDYRSDMQPAACLAKLRRQTRRGSVIVFHDSARCLPLLKQVLPAFLRFLQEEGLQCKAIDTDYP